MNLSWRVNRANEKAWLIKLFYLYELYQEALIATHVAHVCTTGNTCSFSCHWIKKRNVDYGAIGFLENSLLLPQVKVNMWALCFLKNISTTLNVQIKAIFEMFLMFETFKSNFKFHENVN